MNSLQENYIVGPNHGPNKFACACWHTSWLCVMSSFLSCVCASRRTCLCRSPCRCSGTRQDTRASPRRCPSPAPRVKSSRYLWVHHLFLLTVLHSQFAKVKTSLTPLCLFMFSPLQKHYTNNFLIVLFKGFERIFNRSVCTKGFLKTCFLHEDSRHCVYSNTWEMIYQKTLNELHPHSYLCDSTFASLPTKGQKKNQQFLCAAVNRIYAVEPAFLTFPHVQRLMKKKKKELFLSFCEP